MVTIHYSHRLYFAIYSEKSESKPEFFYGLYRMRSDSLWFHPRILHGTATAPSTIQSKMHGPVCPLRLYRETCNSWYFDCTGCFETFWMQFSASESFLEFKKASTEADSSLEVIASWIFSLKCGMDSNLTLRMIFTGCLWIFFVVEIDTGLWTIHDYLWTEASCPPSR